MNPMSTILQSVLAQKMMDQNIMLRANAVPPDRQIIVLAKISATGHMMLNTKNAAQLAVRVRENPNLLVLRQLQLQGILL